MSRSFKYTAVLLALMSVSAQAAPATPDSSADFPAAVGAKTPIQQYKYKLCLGSDTGETDTCEIVFAPIPKNTRADISGASCFIQGQGEVELEYIQLLINKGKTIVTAQTLQPTFTSSVVHPVTRKPRINFSVNNQVTAFAAAGQEIHFYIGFLKTAKSDSITAYCHWSGELVSLK